MATRESAPGADPDRVLGLLGLARRAGRLALGLTAVTIMVRRGRAPLVLTAADAGDSLRQKLARLEPAPRMADLPCGREDLGRALGRSDLAVVAVDDRGFVKGLSALLAAADADEATGSAGDPAATD